jgi:hypothetical protein
MDLSIVPHRHLQQKKDAVIYTSTLSMLSLGLTLTYLTTKVPNFAHRSLAIISSYTLLTFTSVLNLNAYLSIPFAFLILEGASAAWFLTGIGGKRSRFSLQRFHQHRPLPSDADVRLNEVSGSTGPLTHTIELLRSALLVNSREMGLIVALLRMYSGSQGS